MWVPGPLSFLLRYGRHTPGAECPMDKTAVAFYSALAGATVGGAASSLGALWVSRRDVRREARNTTYTEIVPELLDQQENGTAIAFRLAWQRLGRGHYGERERPRWEEVIEALRRQGPLLGRRERNKVAAIVSTDERVRALRRAAERDRERWERENRNNREAVYEADRERASEIEALNVRLPLLLKQLDALLARKIL